MEKENDFLEIKNNNELLLNELSKNVNSFTDEQVEDLLFYFGKLFTEKFASSKKEKLESLINESLPRLVSKLGLEKRNELKNEILSIYTLET